MGFLQAIILMCMVGETVTYSEITFPSFNVAEAVDFSLFGVASLSSSGLEVTPDASSHLSFLSNKSRRVVYNGKFPLYGRGAYTSFFLSLDFNINQTAQGGGVPDNSSGGWLLPFSHRRLRIGLPVVKFDKFDSKMSPGTTDPGDTSLYPYHINLKGGYDIQPLIEYFTSDKTLYVFASNHSDSTPPQPSLVYEIDLSQILADKGAYFCFSASTSNATELHTIKSWNITFQKGSVYSSPGSSNPHVPSTLLLRIAIPVLFIVLIATTGIVVLLKYRRKSQAEAAIIWDAFQNHPGQPREFKYKQLKKATNNFSAAALLGCGGFGTVYRGTLPKENIVVAVKRMAKDWRQGKDEFISEVSIINRLRHRNLVPLLGWCHEKGQLIIVYEYMPNGSLDKHIFNNSDIQGVHLDWEQRYNIVLGVASALLYIHEECEQQVIHRDVKASNIMLDSEYNARLGDFGLARLIQHDRRSFTATAVAGTLGYIAPECFHTGRVTAESDVFSFGAVALEVSCGRRPRSSTGEAAPDLVGWVWKLYREHRLMEAADSHVALVGNANGNEEDIKRLMMLGLACSNPNPADRPTMRDVTQILAGKLPPPAVPPFRPAFIWCIDPLPDISFTTSLSTAIISGNESAANRNRNVSADAEHGHRQTVSEQDRPRLLWYSIGKTWFRSAVQG